LEVEGIGPPVLLALAVIEEKIPLGVDLPVHALRVEHGQQRDIERATAAPIGAELIPDDLGPRLGVVGIDDRKGNAVEIVRRLPRRGVDDGAGVVDVELAGVLFGRRRECLFPARLSERVVDDPVAVVAGLVVLENLRRQQVLRQLPVIGTQHIAGFEADASVVRADGQRPCRDQERTQRRRGASSEGHHDSPQWSRVFCDSLLGSR
jgi:hypothetical protein